MEQLCPLTLHLSSHCDLVKNNQAVLYMHSASYCCFFVTASVLHTAVSEDALGGSVTCMH